MRNIRESGRDYDAVSVAAKSGSEPFAPGAKLRRQGRISQSKLHLTPLGPGPKGITVNHAHYSKSPALA
jgi:hypothetical protein